MSGFCGIVDFDGRPVDRALFARMMGTFAISAPDASASLVDDHGALGYAHLDTGSVHRAMLPATLDGGTLITGDLRLDDRDALAEILGASRDAADHELVLLAFARWGESCPSYLLGDFAFAIWSRDTRELFCARDHFGTKPLYYARRGETFVFSSAIAPLRMHPAVRDDLDRGAVADFLLFGWHQDRESTTFADIRCLPAAHAMMIDRSGVRMREYWTLPVEPPLTSDVVDGFRDVLSRAVRDRTPDNVAVSLSGGLDSSTITAFARDVTPRIDAFTIVFDSLIEDDERPFATAVADRLAIPMHIIDGGAYTLFEKWDDPRYEKDQPGNDPLSAVGTDTFAGAAAHARVMLAGQGGDAVLYASHSYFSELLRRGRLVRFAREIGGYTLRKRRLPPLGLRSRFRRMLRIERKGEPLPSWFNEDFARSTSLEERWARYRATEPDVHPTRPQAYNLLRGSGWQRLNEYVDPAAMRVPIEYRNPYLDVRVVRYLLRVPTMPWFAEKELLRAAAAGKLPDPVRLRRKTPLREDPTHVLMNRQAAELAALVDRTAALDAFVDRRRVAAAIRDPRRSPFESFLLGFPISLGIWMGKAARDPLTIPSDGR